MEYVKPFTREPEFDRDLFEEGHGSIREFVLRDREEHAKRNGAYYDTEGMEALDRVLTAALAKLEGKNATK
jgi:hypothetical protein